MDWVHLTQDRDQWSSLVNMKMNLWGIIWKLIYWWIPNYLSPYEVIASLKTDMRTDAKHGLVS
jgi:hypothetical protein